MESLAEYLGVNCQEPADLPADSVHSIPETLDAKEFARRFLNSAEFKRYLVNSLSLGELPPAIITRMMDYAWGKPVDRVEHTGRDGQPILTEVRRVIVRVNEHLDDIEQTGQAEKLERTH